MSDRFFGSQYGKHSTYYGVNSSSLYGSNFSSVFADAPPPLEDFHEEDDDIVFRNSGKSSPETAERTAVETSVETPEKMFKWASNGESGGNGEEEFGYFSGFADFNSAFSDPGSDVSDKKEWSGESNEERKLHSTDSHKSWPSASINSETEKENGKREVKSQTGNLHNNAFNNINDGDDDDDFADFEGFHSAEEKKDFDSVSTSCNSENENKWPTSPLPHTTGLKSGNGLQAELNQIIKQNGDLQSSEGSPDLSDEDLNINTQVRHSYDKSLNMHIEQKSSKQQNVQQNPIASSIDNTDDFGSFKSINSVATDKTSDTIAIDNSEPPSDSSNKNFPSDSKQRNKNDESHKSVQEDDDFGEFSAVDTLQSSVLFSSSGDNTSSGFGQFESKENKIVHSDSDERQSLANENDFASCPENVNHDFMSSTSLQSCPSHSESASSMNDTKEPVSVDKYSSSINEGVGNNKIDDNNDFGDFSAFDTTTDASGTDSDDILCKKIQKGSLKTTEEEMSIDLSNRTTSFDNEKNVQEQVSSAYFSGENKNIKEKFDELTSTDENSEKIKDTIRNTDNNFCEFATFESGDFNSLGTNELTSGKWENNTRTQGKVDLFKDSANDGIKSNFGHDKSSNEIDDDFGDFSSSDKHNFGSFADFEHKENTLNTNIPSQNNKDSLTTTISANKCVGGNETNVDDFADFSSVSESSDRSNFSASNQNVGLDHETFGEFSSTKTGMDAFSSSKSKSTSDSFASYKVTTEKKDNVGSRYSQGNKSQTDLEGSGAQWPTVQHKSGPEDIFRPGSKVLMGNAGRQLSAAFVSLGQLSGKGMTISPMDSRLSASSMCDMWKELHSSEKNGTLRFQWLLCHSQHKQLLSLNVVPDNLPVTSLLTPGGEGQKNMLPFMTGPGFVAEPNSGPVMSFRSGVKDVDPSQDPFGAPPEVGLPDLSFGFNDPKFPDLKPANGSSGPMALDLDFLTPSTPELTSKQEHRSIYDDLLGLDMEFSLEPQGQMKSVGALHSPIPKLSAGKDSQKVFKFGNVTIPLEPQSVEQELSDKAKEIVTEIEDLSFMLSSVLMFPLKSR